MFLAWIRGAAQLVLDNAQYLTHLDAVIGDADHGINMRRGFQSALANLEATNPSTPGGVLATVGRSFLSDLGGAAGPLYGTGFLQAAETLGEDVDVSAAQLGMALQAALAGIQQLGAAATGDKTMVDALAPAVDAYRAIVDTGEISLRRPMRRPPPPREAFGQPLPCRPARGELAMSANGPSAMRTLGRPPRRLSCRRSLPLRPVPGP